MKKKIFCLVFCLFSIFPAFTSCSFSYERHPKHAYEIAVNEFQCDEILTIAKCNGKEWLINYYGDTDKYFMAVVGKKSGEEVFFLVPATSSKPAITAPWLLNYSFTEINEKVEEFVGYKVTMDEYYGYYNYSFYFQGYELDEYYKHLTGSDSIPVFENNFAIVFKQELLIYQSQGEIVLQEITAL